MIKIKNQLEEIKLGLSRYQNKMAERECLNVKLEDLKKKKNYMTQDEGENSQVELKILEDK